jgi:S1-C subfamily serine protease
VNRLITLALLAVFSCLGAHAQTDKVPVKIKAVLIDRDLNQKPVAKARFFVSAAPDLRLEVTTGFDGAAEIALTPGTYRVISVQPLDFQNKQYSWNVEVKVAAPASNVELSNDNAVSVDAAPVAAVDDLASVYKKYRNSVVTVLAEYGPAKGTGFIVDGSGLVLTNQHVVRTSEFIAVQVDEKRRLPATLLASDSEKDIALLWVNLSKTPDVSPVPLLITGQEPAVEGEKVFTIGSPLHQSKVMTTGIVSKIEKHAIISDVNINHGNSGGPLFNSRGQVIGITTFGDTSAQGGPGISGIVRIEEALPFVERAKGKMAMTSKPSADFLPTDPEDKYPIDALKTSALAEKFKTAPYIFEVGDYDVAVVTPILTYRQFSSEVRAAKEKEKRTKKSQAAVHGTFQPLDNLKNWQEYVGEYEPVILIQASPKLRETFWSAFGRGLAASNGGYGGPARMHFKTDFYKMKLFCGTTEVQPLFPGKIEHVLDVNNAFVRVTDATFDGFYKYPFDAIRPDCGKVTLQLFSEKNPDEPKVKELEQKTVNTVFEDFEPYRKQHQDTSATQPQTAGSDK